MSGQGGSGKNDKYDKGTGKNDKYDKGTGKNDKYDKGTGKKNKYDKPKEKGQDFMDQLRGVVGVKIAEPTAILCEGCATRIDSGKLCKLCEEAKK